MQFAKIRQIMKENPDVNEIFERYDKTREWPFGRVRIDITLDKRTLRLLKEKSKREKKPVSRLIEQLVQRALKKELK